MRPAEHAAKAAIPASPPGHRYSEQAAAAAAMAVVNADPAEALRLTCGWVRNVRLALAFKTNPGDLSRAKRKVFADWGAEAADLRRDFFPGPLWSPAVDTRLLNPDVLTLARRAYEGQSLSEGTLDRARLAPLAHALEAAGCTDTELLAHFHSPGPHVRGCVALDAVLGMK